MIQDAASVALAVVVVAVYVCVIQVKIRPIYNTYL